MQGENVDRNRIALGIRQPWAELILRGVKSIEVRSQPTNVRGTIYVYAAKKWSNFEDALVAAEQYDIDAATGPYGLIVGQVDVVDVRPAAATDAPAACVSRDTLANQYAWVLANPIRFTEPIRPRFLPYGVWFYPFRRRGEEK